MTYTLDQIRQAGKEGEVNHLDVEHIIDLLKECKVETPEQDELWKEVGKRIMDGYDGMDKQDEVTAELKSKYLLIKKQTH